MTPVKQHEPNAIFFGDPVYQGQQRERAGNVTPGTPDRVITADLLRPLVVPAQTTFGRPVAGDSVVDIDPRYNYPGAGAPELPNLPGNGLMQLFDNVWYAYGPVGLGPGRNEPVAPGSIPGDAANNPNTKFLSQPVQRLTNILLPQLAPVAEHATPAEMGTFTLPWLAIFGNPANLQKRSEQLKPTLAGSRY